MRVHTGEDVVVVHEAVAREDEVVPLEVDQLVQGYVVPVRQVAVHAAVAPQDAVPEEVRLYTCGPCALLGGVW